MDQDFGGAVMKYLHTMVRVRDLEASLKFYCDALGLVQVSRYDNDAGRFTLVFLCAPDDVEAAKASRAPTVELTWNWDDEAYTGGRNFGHLAYAVDNIYQSCERLQAAGVLINRPPRDGHMAFVRSPEGISVELLQAGERLAPAEPWLSMANTGEW
jgi:lactoylglutathione lyase